MLNKRPLTYLTYYSLFAIALTITSVGTALPLMQKTYGANYQQIGILFITFSVGSLLAVLVGGYLVDVIKIKPVYLAGQIFLNGGCFIFALSKSLILGASANLFLGISWGLLEVATNTLVANLYKGTKGASLNLLHVFFGVGAMVGPVFFSLFLQLKLNWQNIFLLIFLICFLQILFLIKLKIPDNIHGEKTNLLKFQLLLKNPYLILLGITIACYSGWEASINNWLVSYFENVLGAVKLLAGSFLSFFWIAMTIGRMSCVKLERIYGESKILFLLSLMAVIFFTLFIISKNVYLAGTFIILTGLFMSGIFATILALGTIKFPQNSGTINGLLMSYACLGLAIFPFLMGVVAQKTNLKLGLAIGIVLAFLIFLLPIITQKYLKKNYS